MFYLLVTVQVKPEAVSEFIPAQIDMAQKVLSEPGCLRYDVLQDNENPYRFYRCEVYRDEPAFADHGAMLHTSEFRELTREWWAEPLSVIRTSDVYLSDDSLAK
jgi:autoinducer 2-degrading protein